MYWNLQGELDYTQSVKMHFFSFIFSLKESCSVSYCDSDLQSLVWLMS